MWWCMNVKNMCKMIMFWVFSCYWKLLDILMVEVGYVIDFLCLNEVQFYMIIQIFGKYVLEFLIVYNIIVIIIF